MDVNEEGAQASTSDAPVTIPTNEADYAAWRISGKLPESQKAETPIKDAAAEAKTAESETPVEKTEKSKDKGVTTSPVETKEVEPKPKAKSPAAIRLDEILGDLKQAGLTPTELKTFKARKAEAAKETTELPEKSAEKPKRPRYRDFEGDEEKYEEAVDKYEADKAEFDRRAAIEDFQRLTSEQKTKAEMTESLDNAKKRYGTDAHEIITDTAGRIARDKAIPAAIKAVINESPVVADLMYVMGEKPEDLAEFIDLCRTQPGAAMRRAVLLERLVMEELAKGKKAKAPEEEPEEKAETKTGAGSTKITRAPPPPREIGGNKGKPADEAQEAFEAQDFGRYRRIKNAQDLARMKGLA